MMNNVGAVRKWTKSTDCHSLGRRRTTPSPCSFAHFFKYLFGAIWLSPNWMAQAAPHKNKVSSFLVYLERMMNRPTTRPSLA